MLPGQIVIMLGPSGAGKTRLSDDWAAVFGWLHIDTDDTDRLRHYRLKEAWGAFYDADNANPKPLIHRVEQLIADAGKAGAVVSFRCSIVPSRSRINVARAAGIVTVVLWGTPEQCEQSARQRRDDFTHKQYVAATRRIFKAYSGSEFDDIRVGAFSPDGNHLGSRQLISIIQRQWPILDK
jgi:hypothetical protein